MAQDADEPVTLDEVMRRVMRKEKQAAAAFPGSRATKNTNKSAPAIPGVGQTRHMSSRPPDNLLLVH